MNLSHYKIIEIEDAEFVVVAKDDLESEVVGEEINVILFKTCTLMAAQDFVMRRALIWSVFLKAEDDYCQCDPHEAPKLFLAKEAE